MHDTELYTPIFEELSYAGWCGYRLTSSGTGRRYAPDIMAIRRHDGIHDVIHAVVVKSRHEKVHLSEWMSFRRKWQALRRESRMTRTPLYLVFRYAGPKSLDGHRHGWFGLEHIDAPLSYPIVSVATWRRAEEILGEV